MKATVVVTGGEGFIGSYVIETLVSMGHPVISIDPRKRGSLYVHDELVEYWACGVENAPWTNMLRKKKIQHIIHLGAWSNVRESMTEPMELYVNNTVSTVHIIDAILTLEKHKAGHAVKSVVFASSSAVEAPESHYGVSKAASEMMLDVFRMQMEGRISVSNLRFGNVYGPRQNPANGTLIASFVDCLVDGVCPDIYGEGKQTRDYIYVTDVADAIIMCAFHEGGPAGFMLSDTMNVSNGVSWSVDEVYDHIKRAADNLGMDLAEAQYIERRPGDKDEVKMPISQVLLSEGWNSEVCLYDGISQQIKWAISMKGDWDDDHFIDGSLSDEE